MDVRRQVYDMVDELKQDIYDIYSVGTAVTGTQTASSTQQSRAAAEFLALELFAKGWRKVGGTRAE